MSSAILVLLVANVVAFIALSVQDEYHSPIIQSNSNSQSIAPRRSLLERRQQQQALPEEDKDKDDYSLQDVKILVAIAAFDFSQLPHLEEVLDGYHDLCISGAIVRVVIHTTVAWPVPMMDLLQTRFTCPIETFRIDLVLKSPRVRLHLVDYHRKLFYSQLEEYDVFIYTEDDQRVTPRTVATYLHETRKIERLLKGRTDYQPSDFNVGIVRYEYNYPSNVVMDDTTRHATENVTRVYWEHSSFKPPVIPNAMDAVPQNHVLGNNYVHMKNHHQGMFLATRSLLKAWKDRDNCQFDIASNRPGRPNQPSQPLLGTQRVWMSSAQLFGMKKHGCRVQQVIPMDQFGALTVHHIPNKNYRRVGQYRSRDTNRDEGVVVEQEQLLTALQLHIALTKALPPKPKQVRFTMTVDPDRPRERPDESWSQKLQAFEAYVQRGGIMSEEDMQEEPSLLTE